MPIEIQTSLMAGGLDLTTPQIAMPAGRAISSLNYESDLGGYTSHGGYERFDGRARPSDTTDPALVEERRGAIQPVPGIGTVRGVWVYEGNVYAFRDHADGGTAGMYRATPGGWSELSFGKLINFHTGTSEFLIGEYVAGLTSSATALIDRVVLKSGAWDGTAVGYLVVSDVFGAFVDENLLSGSGAATGLAQMDINILSGGRYDFTNHNFYGSLDRTRMYFVNGVDTAFEWSGSTLTPIQTGLSGGVAANVDYLLAANGDFILAANGDSIIMAARFDTPSFIAPYANHLFLGYTSGTLINSALGEPLEYTTTRGAGEIAFGEQITGLLTAASTSLVVFAQNRLDYLTGTDATTFTLNPITASSGAQPYTIQMLDSPMFLDDGGIRSMPTTAAFGGWRIGSVTPLIETLIRQKRDTPIEPVATMLVKSRDQYKLFWADGSGLTVFIGRKNPEAMPFSLPIRVFHACAGEVVNGQGDRLFVGCQDGYVYEMNRGTSFDGAPIDSYIRLPFNSTGSPSQHTRWLKVTYEIDTPDTLNMGVVFHTDYGRGDPGPRTDVGVPYGTSLISTADYDTIDWLQPVEGRLEYHLAGIGPNVSMTLIHSANDKRQHTISSQTYNYSRRRLKR